MERDGPVTFASRPSALRRTHCAPHPGTDGQEFEGLVPRKPSATLRRMETNELHRGRLIDHLQLVVSDLEASKKFYTAVLGALGIPYGGDGPGFFWIDELCVSSVDSPAAQGKLTGRVHLAFQAADKKAVEEFYRVGLEVGGSDLGKPGDRPYHPGYYAAFLTDPDGNNVEAVYHGPHKRSAPSVHIEF